MPRVIALLVYLVVVFAGGGLLAPWMWWGAQSLSGATAWGWAEALAAQPFTRYVHRCVLGVALLGLWPLARALGIGVGSALGGRGTHGRGLRHAGMAFLVGAAMFGATLAVECVAGWREVRTGIPPARWAGMMGNAAASGLAVGVLEEILFRGVLCRGLAGRIGWWPAIGCSSLVYAWTHFLSKGSRPAIVEWWSGWGVVRDMVVGSATPGALLPGFPTLVLAGILLGCLLRDTGSLHASMGLHFGWVFWIKMRGALTVRVIEPGAGWGESRISAGWPGLAAVAVALVLYLAWRGSEGRRPRSP